MDRRTLLAAGLAAPIAASFPAFAAPAPPSRVEWLGDSWESRHRGTMARWMLDHWWAEPRKPVLIQGESYIRELLTLNDPRFTITPYNRIFSVQKGWIEDRDGLELWIKDDGVNLPPLRIGSTHGLGLKQDDPRRDQYFVRTMCMEWDDPRREALDHRLKLDLSELIFALQSTNVA